MARLVKPVLRAIEHPRRETHRLARSVWRTTVGAADESSPRDVWKWTAPKYRFRTVGLLLLNALLFAGLGFFAFWLRTGAYGPFSEENYWHAWWEVFDPTSAQQVTLIDFLLRPIPVNQVPIMMVIVGLVLASLTAIPILVSMLYRFPFSLIFTAIIGFVALFPWLAITITFCCFLARWRPFRFNFRFATALLSLLPVLVYYALATRDAQVLEHLEPVEKAKLYLPWVFALIAACMVMGIVLGVARLVNDRPGAIAPAMAILFVLPVVLFEVKVGRDELYYRLVERQFGPGSTTHFVNHIDASETVERIARRRLEEAHRESSEPLSQAAMEEQVQLLLQFQFNAVRADLQAESDYSEEAFASQQHEAMTGCDRFLARYPSSQYCPNVLYLKGRALDMRVDRELFRRKGILRHYEEFPNMASKPAWERLAKEYPDSPLASVALYRLAVLLARSGDVDGAIVSLERLVERFGRTRNQSTQPEQPATLWTLFAKRPAPSSLGVVPADVAMQGRKLLAMLKNNRDPQQRDLALQELMRLDPRDARYVRNLRDLLASIDTKYPLTLLRDNLELLIASAEPSQSLRIRALESCVQKFARDPASDAYLQAQYELGLAYKADNRMVEARTVLESVVAKDASSPWAMEAQRQLAEMGMFSAERR